MESAGWLERMRSDHRQVIERLEQVAPGTGDASARPISEIRAFVEFLARQFDHHMAAEDQVLFPILVDALPAITESLAPLRVEHRELRAMLDALAALLQAPEGGARDQQIQVQLADLAELLRIHIRKEERLVFQVAERVLRPGELDRLVSDRTSGSAPRSEPRSPNPRTS